ncbi:MAG: hypothetical protein IPJ98_07990 [Bryobacterales bacterium]|nr:hypothetical protein [Bryobacterales bacterium]
MPAPVASRRARLLTPFALQTNAAADPLAIASVRLFAAPSRLYVRIETRSGIKGWGDCAPAGAEALTRARQQLLNQPASAYAALEGALPAEVAPAAVAAMLDCLGQHTKAPVYQLLGGPTRFKVRVMAHVASAAEVRAARSSGHRAFALAIPAPPFPNSGKLYVNRIRALFDEARAAAGEGCDFVLNAGGQLTAGDAAQLAAEFERTHLLWLEEPCRHGNHAALRKLGEEAVTPIGLGRDCRHASEFQDILREETADLLRPSLDHFSLTRIRKIAALAETYYIAVAPTHTGGMLATAAALHAAASMPNFFLTHLPARAPDDPVRGLDLTVRDGYLGLPTAPGLGITVDDAAIARYEVRA